MYNTIDYKELEFFNITNSDCNLSYLPTKSLNQSVRILSWSAMLEHFEMALIKHNCSTWKPYVCGPDSQKLTWFPKIDNDLSISDNWSKQVIQLHTSYVVN